MKEIYSLNKYFTLGRELDWGTFSNRFALIASVLTFIIFVLYSLVFLTQNLMDLRNIWLPAQAAILSFLTWAIAREFDPEDHLTAISSQVLMSLAIFWFFPEFDPMLLGLFLVLLGSRLINNLTGIDSTKWDALIITGLGVSASILTMNWLFALIGGFALIIDTLFKKENLSNYIFAALSVAVSVYLIITGDVYRYVIYLPPLLEYILLFLLVVTFLVRFFYRRKIEIRNDLGGEVDRNRVIAGSFFLLASLVAITIFGGEDFYVTGSPIWAIAFVYPFIGVLNRD